MFLLSYSTFTARHISIKYIPADYSRVRMAGGFTTTYAISAYDQ